MPYTQEQKAKAYELDPECWVSYSGKPKPFRQAMDLRRRKSLNKAVDLVPDENPVVVITKNELRDQLVKFLFDQIAGVDQTDANDLADRFVGDL